MSGCNGGGPLNSFALVTYLPDPLADFIDGLRGDLEPGCVARAHVTILPPRPLSCSPDAAWNQIVKGLEQVQPFRVELQEVKIFGRSDVIYISIGDGWKQLREIHSTLDYGYCHVHEAWEYCPHITLFQTLDSSEVAARFRLAVRRWDEFRYPRSFILDQVSLVQNTWGNRWRDLHHYDLAASPALKG